MLSSTLFALNLWVQPHLTTLVYRQGGSGAVLHLGLGQALLGGQGKAPWGINPRYRTKARDPKITKQWRVYL